MVQGSLHSQWASNAEEEQPHLAKRDGKTTRVNSLLQLNVSGLYFALLCKRPSEWLVSEGPQSTKRHLSRMKTLGGNSCCCSYKFNLFKPLRIMPSEILRHRRGIRIEWTILDQGRFHSQKKRQTYSRDKFLRTSVGVKDILGGSLLLQLHLVILVKVQLSKDSHPNGRWNVQVVRTFLSSIYRLAWSSATRQ